ncbi:hypothetical protein ATC1_13322 [Flexilinea flocculi]|jgi:hypothetical protein|uniref:Uncharacterized protein n=1 Tax=Flexilinea flocculi TaxID=1678840 RepID=A0A0S7BRP4_9CHLR|nr:hypothetical protein ATC1_13322 [Flexilinea flocculi]
MVSFSLFDNLQTFFEKMYVIEQMRKNYPIAKIAFQVIILDTIINSECGLTYQIIKNSILNFKLPGYKRKTHHDDRKKDR